MVVMDVNQEEDQPPKRSSNVLSDILQATGIFGEEQSAEEETPMETEEDSKAEEEKEEEDSTTTVVTVDAASSEEDVEHNSSAEAGWWSPPGWHRHTVLCFICYPFSVPLATNNHHQDEEEVASQEESEAEINILVKDATVTNDGERYIWPFTQPNHKLV